MLAKELHIGQAFGTVGEGNNLHIVKIKRLHETCAERPGPHVHIVTSHENTCLAFNTPAIPPVRN